MVSLAVTGKDQQRKFFTPAVLSTPASYKNNSTATSHWTTLQEAKNAFDRSRKLQKNATKLLSEPNGILFTSQQLFLHGSCLYSLC